MHANREQLTEQLVVGSSSICSATFGELEAAINVIEAGADFGPVFEVAFSDRGGRCDVPHWGYVVDGEMIVGYAGGREERCVAGEVFYMAPGHTARTESGCTTVDFSPAAPMARFVADLQRFLEGQPG